MHEKHHNDKELKRFAGWYGHNKERRFKMEPDFDPVHGADGWQISNLPILSLAPYLASVEMFAEVGMDKLITKRNLITSYLEFILHEIDKELEGSGFRNYYTIQSRRTRMSVVSIPSRTRKRAIR